MPGAVGAARYGPQAPAAGAAARLQPGGRPGRLRVRPARLRRHPRRAPAAALPLPRHRWVRRAGVGGGALGGPRSRGRGVLWGTGLRGRGWGRAERAGRRALGLGANLGPSPRATFNPETNFSSYAAGRCPGPARGAADGQTRCWGRGAPGLAVCGEGLGRNRLRLGAAQAPSAHPAGGGAVVHTRPTRPSWEASQSRFK